jgi:arylamine N-acetyltransferase
MTASLLDAYLHRLGLIDRPPATLEGLRKVHRAHVARIPYDNLSIMLDRPDPVDVESCLARVADGGRLGYCLHQNAALGWLLSDLGFSVSTRHGHVWSRPETQLDPFLNHLVLVVSGLPTADNPGGHWWPDAGLGEGFAEPLPLVRGDHDVDGWSYGIGAGYGAQAAGRPTGPAAWTYRHLPGGVIQGVVVTSRDHGPAAIRATHRQLSLGEDSSFRRIVVAQRIEGPRQIALRGCVLTEMTPTSNDQRDLTSYDDWRGALADELLVPTDDVTDAEWASLWERTTTAHRAWDEAGRP